MIMEMAGDRTLPAEVVQQILAKTDGVPLFVEELTKSVIEIVGVHSRAPLQALAIPATLHDSLMARLDRLNRAKEIAQVAAVLGREFSYDVLHAALPLDEEALQHGLRQLVKTELVYQRGMPPQAAYTFKHALIQDAAYQSLLKSRRQQLHRQIAHVLEERFSGTKETQPELLAYHYSTGAMVEQALPYWHRAGQHAAERSAYTEAIHHLTSGLELLNTLPETPERAQQELQLQISLGGSLLGAKGWSAPEVERTYTRIQDLCRQLGETPQLFSALYGLRIFYQVRGEYQRAYELGHQFVQLAENLQDPVLLVGGHFLLGDPLFWTGEFVSARRHFERAATLYDRRQHKTHIRLFGHDLGVMNAGYQSINLWYLGYPDRALQVAKELCAEFLSQDNGFPFACMELRRERG
jgi:tetratricopeptide (TPR) repeat protein